jgi:membrane protein
MANYNIIYGSIGAVVALMVWLYLLMASALMGCEYNAERLREEVYPGKLEPPA